MADAHMQSTDEKLLPDLVAALDEIGSPLTTLPRYRR